MTYLAFCPKAQCPGRKRIIKARVNQKVKLDESKVADVVDVEVKNIQFLYNWMFAYIIIIFTRIFLRRLFSAVAGRVTTGHTVMDLIMLIIRRIMIMWDHLLLLKNPHRRQFGTTSSECMFEKTKQYTNLYEQEFFLHWLRVKNCLNLFKNVCNEHKKVLNLHLKEDQ